MTVWNSSGRKPIQGHCIIIHLKASRGNESQIRGESLSQTCSLQKIFYCLNVSGLSFLLVLLFAFLIFVYLPFSLFSIRRHSSKLCYCSCHWLKFISRYMEIYVYKISAAPYHYFLFIQIILNNTILFIFLVSSSNYLIRM